MNTLLANHKEHFKVLLIRRRTRHLERMPVTLSAAKGLARRTQRSFAALRMTARTPLKPAHGKPYLQMSKRRLARRNDVLWARVKLRVYVARLNWSWSLCSAVCMALQLERLAIRLFAGGWNE